MIKNIALVRNPDGDCAEIVIPEKSKTQVITDEQVFRISNLCQSHRKNIMAATWIWNWGVDERDNKIWILQARPETVWSRKNKEVKPVEKCNRCTDYHNS